MRSRPSRWKSPLRYAGQPKGTAHSGRFGKGVRESRPVWLRITGFPAFRAYEGKADGMPHAKRTLSESGFYHIVTKGDGGQAIFRNNDDRRHYVDLLEQSALDNDIEVHAYCLMANHVHLLAKVDATVEAGCLSAFMKQLDGRYATYFAKKTSRIGHVFQGRYWSEPVKDDACLLGALRYIHANPEPAGICRAQKYPWSSYQAYIGEPSFVQTSHALSLLGGKDQFARHSRNGGKYVKPFAESKLQRHLSHDELVRVACGIVGRQRLLQMKGAHPNIRRELLWRLSNAGFSEREIARLTGISRYTIHNDVTPST